MPIGTIQKKDDAYVMVKIERQDMCGECHACEVIAEKKSCEIKCLNRCNGKEGDKVEVDLSQNLFIRATIIMYGVPLAGLLVGLGLGMLVPETLGIYAKEGTMLVLGGLLMSLGFLWIRYKDKKEKYNELLPIAKKILE